MMILHAFTALTHAASQIFYRWLPPPLPEFVSQIISHLPSAVASQYECEGGLSSLTRDQWLLLLRLDFDTLDIFPWRKKLSGVGASDELLVDLLMRHLAFVAKSGAHYVTLHDANYPSLLRNTSDAPLALTIQGNLACFKQHLVSVVGSRKASVLALQESFSVGKALATVGHGVVSGGALGCDIAAHQGALASGRIPVPTVCVFAGGLAAYYPRTNDWLFRKLTQAGGLFVSERFWWASARPMDFPVRNRIIAGLSELTLVMQASDRSGALITARQALDRGRDVAVLRHPKGDIRASGSELLIAEGAPAFAPTQNFEGPWGDWRDDLRLP
jgi:DNA protecting protein DprA